MKSILSMCVLALVSVMSMSAMAAFPKDINSSEASSLVLSIQTGSTSGAARKEQVLKAAKDDAAAYVAAGGKTLVNANLRNAIEVVRAEDSFQNASELVIVSEILDRAL